MAKDGPEAVPIKWRAVAAAFCGIVSVIFFLFDAFDELIFHGKIDLAQPAYGFLAAFLLFFFGIKIGDILPMLVRAVGRGLSTVGSEKEDDGTTHDPK